MCSQIAISALQSVLQEDFKATEIEVNTQVPFSQVKFSILQCVVFISIPCDWQVGVVRKEDRVFRSLTTEEIDQHLTAISERD